MSSSSSLRSTVICMWIVWQMVCDCSQYEGSSQKLGIPLWWKDNSTIQYITWVVQFLADLSSDSLISSLDPSAVNIYLLTWCNAVIYITALRRNVTVPDSKYLVINMIIVGSVSSGYNNSSILNSNWNKQILIIDLYGTSWNCNC